MVATSSLVLVSFLLPLALVLRTLAADRAVSAAMAQTQSLAPLVTSLPARSLRLTVAQVNAGSGTPVTIFLPDGTVVGSPAASSPSVELARHGASFSSAVAGGVEVLVAVDGLPGGTAVIRSFVPDAQLHHGVARAWLLLLAVGAFLLVLSVVVADQLARSLVRPLIAVAQAAELLAAGDLSARAAVAGPPEVRLAGTGLNRLATRIGDLLARERESVADLSHRLRTPLTALRIDAESLRDSRLIDDVAMMERTVSEIIREARRQRGEARGDAVRREPGDRRARGVLAPARGRPGTPDERQRATGRGTRPGVTRRPRGLRGRPAGERLHAHAGGRGPRRPGQPPRGRRRVACRVATTGRASRRAARCAAACPARAPPASAWTSHAGSPRSPAAPWPSASPRQVAAVSHSAWAARRAPAVITAAAGVGRS